MIYNNNSAIICFSNGKHVSKEKKPHLLNTVWQCQLRFLHSRKSELSFQQDDVLGLIR